jgi:hypothetical protein
MVRLPLSSTFLLSVVLSILPVVSVTVVLLAISHMLPCSSASCEKWFGREMHECILRLALFILNSMLLYLQYFCSLLSCLAIQFCRWSCVSNG